MEIQAHLGSLLQFSPKGHFSGRTGLFSACLATEEGLHYSSPASGLVSGTLSIAASNLRLSPRVARWTKSCWWLLHAPTAWAMANAARRSTGTPSMLARCCMDFKTGAGSSAVIVLMVFNLPHCCQSRLLSSATCAFGVFGHCAKRKPGEDAEKLRS